MVICVIASTVSNLEQKSMSRQLIGLFAVAGGTMGIILAPILVIIKYMTGWKVIPEPAWVDTARETLGVALEFASPPGLWMVYGSAYTISLVLMLAGLGGLSGRVKSAQSRVATAGYWIVIVGLCMVIPGDAIHTWTRAPEWADDSNTRYQPSGEHCLRSPYDGYELHYGRVDDNRYLGIAPKISRTVVSLVVCYDLSHSGRSFNHCATNDAQWCAMVLQHHDDCLWILPCDREA
jgi:hypothetical protein